MQLCYQIEQFPNIKGESFRDVLQKFYNFLEADAEGTKKGQQKIIDMIKKSGINVVRCDGKALRPDEKISMMQALLVFARKGMKFVEEDE